MEIKVILRHLRISPRKAREVIDLVRGKKATEAKTILEFAVKRATAPVLKLLNSAVASAKNDLHLDESNLFISKITVDEGPTLKRWHAMSRGRAYPIMKRTSHVTLVLSEINPTKKKEAKIEKKATKSKSKESNVKPQKNSKKRNTKFKKLIKN